ncbi:MAG TPA: magnesium/cobalt transporter CorA [Drouetiella sp.]
MTSESARAKRRQQRTQRITAEFNMPGGFSVDGSSATETPLMHILAYSEHGYVEQAVRDPAQLIEYLAKWPVTWINVDPVGFGPNAQAFMERLGKLFNLHELELEDIINVHQRAKVEEYEEHIFVVTRMLVNRDSAESEQLSLFLGKNFVLTFREMASDCLDPVRDKIRKSRGRIRFEKADYLMYAIIDAVVDSYFPLLAKLADRLDTIEEEILEKSEKNTPEDVYEVRRDVLAIRKSVWPTREALSSLYRDTNPLVSEHTRLYLRDCYDHAVRIIDFVEMYREVASALMELHYTRVSNRLNEVMKVLTIITTLFIGPSFVASLYGMNFNTDKSPLNMPELSWYFGYPLALSLMAIFSLSILMYLYFRGFLGPQKRG